MKPSFVKPIVRAVLICWLVVILSMVLYGRTKSWITERAQTDGIFLAHELLAKESPEARPERLQALQAHYQLPLSLLPPAEVAQQLGRPIEPGEHAPLRVSAREEWYFLAFERGQPVLTIGPVHPSIPKGFFPVGALLAFFLLPLLASLLAFRLERELTKVERASQALAVGELSARVDNPDGPSAELAASFNAMAERIEQLVRSRDELVQAVSHELGSPLSRLRFHMELLENQTEEQRDERLRAMARELEALEELVAELLHYVQSDDRSPDPCSFDPLQTLTDLAELASLEIPEDRPLEVALDLPENVVIRADPRQLQRATENLLRNAIQHAEQRVLLELTLDDEAIHVTVHDDGPGIPVKLREKVLSPFVRLEADRGRKTGGVGLGLAIVHRILQRHAGQVSITTSPLGGAMVRTSWPRTSPR